MTPKLTAEQLNALNEAEGPVSVEDALSHRRYYIVDEAMLHNLRHQGDLAAIREGIADVENGRVAPLAEVVARIQVSIDSP